MLFLLDSGVAVPEASPEDGWLDGWQEMFDKSWTPSSWNLPSFHGQEEQPSAKNEMTQSEEESVGEEEYARVVHIHVARLIHNLLQKKMIVTNTPKCFLVDLLLFALFRIGNPLRKF